MTVMMPHVKEELLRKAQMYESPMKDLLYVASKYIEEIEEYYKESNRKADE